MARSHNGIGYRDIAMMLTDEIRAGTWKTGDPMPTEFELIDRFGVGRNTVREALRELETQGFIGRRRGARSVLKSTTPQDAFVNSVRSIDELLKYATSARATLLVSEIVRVDDKLAARLECEPDSEWMRAGILRYREQGESPFCYSEIYLDPAYRDVVEMIGTETQIYPMIERHHGVVLQRVVQDIEAAAADANIASRLHIQLGSPILLVRTRFLSQEGETVEIGLSYFPAGRYRVRMSLDRRGTAV